MTKNTTTAPPGQLTGRWRDHFETRLELIPPLSEDFTGHLGDSEATDRARRWALDGRYLLADGPTRCAHAFYLLPMCPALGGCGYGDFLDHARVWVDYDNPAEPFLLAHLYRDSIPAEALSYAAHHGLRASTEFLDDWYGYGTLPVRLSVNCTGTMPWPLGTRATVMVSAYPVAWPDPGDTGPGPWLGWAEEKRRTGGAT